MQANLLDWEPRYPEVPGCKERGGASEEAAKAVKPKAAVIRVKVMRALIENPEGLTAPHVRRILGRGNVTLNSVRSRLSELSKPDDDGRVLAYKRSKRRADPESDHEIAVYRAIRYREAAQ